MKTFETIASNLDAAAKNKQDKAEQAVDYSVYRKEQRRLSLPFVEKTLVIARDIQELVPYEQMIESPKILFGARKAERRRQETIANLRAKPPELLSGYGYLDGNPKHVVVFRQGFREDASVHHNNVPVYHFSPMYSSRVAVVGASGLMDYELRLDQERADEISDYLDQIQERVEWQQADQIIGPARGHSPGSFSEHIAADQQGNAFFDQF